MSAAGKLIALTAVVGSAIAINAPPPGVPLNSQDGLFRFPINCSIFNFINGTFPGIYTAVAPVVAGPGQEIYYTRVNAQLTLPANFLFDLAPLIGVTQASANVRVALDVTNAAVSTVDVFPNGLQINNISVPFNQDIVVDVPGNGKVIPPIGPVKMANKAGLSHVIYLGEVNILVSLQNSNGDTVLSNIPVVCPVQNPQPPLGVVTIAGPPGGKALSFPGGPVKLPLVPSLYEVGTFRFPYSCNFGKFGTLDVDLAITGSVKSALLPGEQYYLNNATAFIRVPQPIIKALKSVTPGLAYIQTTFSTFNIGATNSNPSSINALKSRLVSTVPVGTGALQIPVPETGSLQIGPLTADNTAGETIFLSVGTASASAALLDSTKKNVGTIPISCTPKYDIDLIG